MYESGQMQLCPLSMNKLSYKLEIRRVKLAAENAVMNE